MGKKSSKNMNKKMQHQMWLANESPEPVYDLSQCELQEIPEGVFSTCKVLQKQALILHTNSISSLTENGNKVANLARLLVLDLNTNRLSKLPAEISCLSQLQVLNVSHNAITSLPPEIQELKRLQTFNISDNQLSRLPHEMGNLPSLRTLNISSNKVHKLPKTLCRVATLESLTLDVDTMKYPDRAVCQQGIEAIMKRICADGGVEYVPPSRAVLPLLQGASNTPTVNPAIAHLHPDNIQPMLSSYEETRRRKHQQSLLIEQENMEETEHLDQLLRDQQLKKVQHIAGLAEDNRSCEENITLLQMKQDTTRQRLYDLILEEDTRATEQILEIIKSHNESKVKEDLLLHLEDEKERELAQICIKNEEIGLLRKEEMMRRMMEALRERQGFDVQVDKYLQERDEAIRTAQRLFVDEDRQITSKLISKEAEQHEAVSDMAMEDEWQKAALHALITQRDSRHSQLTQDISSLEHQLARLSIVEMGNRMADNQSKHEMLREQREHLAQVLLQLMERRDQRLKEIARRMVEMEEAREADLADFWLAQMQRLLDRKPQSQIDRESQLEIAVLDILNMAEASDYVSRFAQHKISIETMRTLTDEDLRRIGVHEVGLRKAILTNTKIYLKKMGDQPADKYSTKSMGLTDDIPSAPPDSQRPSVSQPAVQSTSRTPAEVLTHVTTECVVCMERQTSIVFLPCGHVCTCLECSHPLLICPMCRSDISQKIILEH